MTTSRQGITMTARLRSPTFQRISVIAEQSESFWTVSGGSNSVFLEERKLIFLSVKFPPAAAPHIHWFSPGRSLFHSSCRLHCRPHCRLHCSLDGAEEKIFENIGLQDYLESFLSPRRESQAKCMNLCWRIEDNSGLDPLSIWNTARTAPTQGLQFLK